MARKRSTASSLFSCGSPVTAFFLFDVIVYISGTILLATIFYPVLRNLYGLGVTKLAQTDQVLNAFFGLDRLGYDIQRTSRQADYGKKQEQAVCAMAHGLSQVRWYLSNQRVMRAEQHSNRRTVSTVFTHCVSLSFVYYTQATHDIYGVGYGVQLAGFERLKLSGFAAPRIGSVI